MNQRTTDFISLLVNLSQRRTVDFPGLGIVWYKNLHGLKEYHSDLVPNSSAPSLELGTDLLTAYLLEISRCKHSYHDGFHFINADGILTHVAQYLSPPINNLKNVQNHGARAFSSLCGSKIKGVILIGNICQNNNIIIYKNGSSQEIHVHAGNKSNWSVVPKG